MFEAILKMRKKSRKWSFSKLHRHLWSYPKSAQKAIKYDFQKCTKIFKAVLTVHKNLYMDIILKSARKLWSYPNSAQGSVDINLKSTQKSLKLS